MELYLPIRIESYDESYIEVDERMKNVAAWITADLLELFIEANKKEGT